MAAADVDGQTRSQRENQKLRSTSDRLPGSSSKKTPKTKRTTAQKSHELNSELVTDEWAWTTLTESTVSGHPVVFTKNNSYFFSISGSSVRIYSSSTGKLVSTLLSSPDGSEYGGSHSDRVTAAMLNPFAPLQLLTSSLDGLIRIWDFMDGTLLQTLDVGSPITHMCASKKTQGHVFVAVTPSTYAEKSEGKRKSLILKVSLTGKNKPGRTGPLKPTQVVHLGKTKPVVDMGVAPSGSWLVVVSSEKTYVLDTASQELGLTKFTSTGKLTSFAFHPSEDYFATGDQDGQIRLWYCLNDKGSTGGKSLKERKTPTTVMHWHAHPVQSLAFTPNGAYLLSGGEESVLVIWQLHSGAKEFVPRVGAPIISIAIRAGAGENEEYLLGLADHSFVFVKASTLTISRTVSRIRMDPAISHERPLTNVRVPLAIHPTTNDVILPSSHPSSLQTYSVPKMSVISELEVSQSNRVSRRDEKPIEPSRVELVAVCSSGEWMATIDRRTNEDEFTTEVYLKFWHLESSNWCLNTRIDQPHGDKAITAVSFSPSAIRGQGWILTTAGLDGRVKTWTIRTAKTKNNTIEEFWTNRSSITFRSEIPSNTSWSSDASLFAVAFGPYVVLYEPSSNSQLDVLTSSEVRVTQSLHFVGQSSRYLFVSSKSDAIMWDMVTRSISWHYESPNSIHHAAPHPENDLVALFTQPDERRTNVLVFQPNSRTPLESKSVPFQLKELAWYRTSTRFSFVGITTSWNVTLLGDDVARIEDAGTSSNTIKNEASTTRRATLYQDIFGKSAFDGIPEFYPSPNPVELPNPERLQSFFDSPAHLSPPMETVYSSLMKGFAPKKLAESPNDEVIDASGVEDEEMLDVEETHPRVTAPILDIDDTELEGLSQFFRQQCFSPNFGSKRSSANGGANGTPKPKRNGTHHLAPAEQKRPPEPTTSSPVAAGVKRKISIV